MGSKRLVFFNNSLNHHQVNVADEFYKLLGDNYAYVATVAKNKAGLKGGVDYSTRPYCILAGDSEEARQHAVVLAKNAEVCVFGAESLNYAIERATLNPSGLSFELSERWLKRGWINILSPRLIRWWLAYQRHYRKANFYKLNASAFAAEDHLKLHTYKGRMFKWGYFTQVDEEFDVEASIVDASTSEIIPLMWCGRFLTLKHPELPVMMAKKLKDKGYKFMLSMYGDEGNAAKHDGIYPRKKLEALIEELDVGDCVQLMGNRPNNEIIQAMRNSAIFLFTSDSHEGWGAVANESLSSGCVLVGSDAIGSVPYLVQDGFNGFKFRSEDAEDLIKKVEHLIANRSELKRMQINAHERMIDVWSPKHAADSFLVLIEELQRYRPCSIKSGPCSIA
ncbi:MAG: glycosyltransferase [Bacteroidales bacterium]|nr:glycosyltransferase [Bacteroidales bacterium]